MAPSTTHYDSSTATAAVAVVTADLAHCFFVGDAAGRPEDFAATDKDGNPVRGEGKGGIEGGGRGRHLVRRGGEVWGGEGRGAASSPAP